VIVFVAAWLSFYFACTVQLSVLEECSLSRKEASGLADMEFDNPKHVIQSKKRYFRTRVV
jgi:hypothetical protein